MRLKDVPEAALIRELERRGHVVLAARPVGMSPAQKAVYDFVRDAVARGAPAPSLHEISEHIGAKSRSTAHRIVAQLVVRGVLKKTPRRMHSVTVA